MQQKIFLTGTLKEFHLPEVLLFCSRSQKTGELLLKRGDSEKHLYFTNGKIVFASSSQASDRLGDILLQTGKITEEQYHRAAEIAARTGKRKGIILVEEGYIQAESLIPALNEQIKEIILGLFEWEKGTFTFRESPLSDEVITANISLIDLLREAVKRQKLKKEQAAQLEGEDAMRVCERWDSLSHYERLGINMDASYAEIRKAYFEKVKACHPDKYDAMQNPILSKKLTTALALLNEAYNTLTDKRSKEKYDRSILHSSRMSEPTYEARIAQEHFIRGKSLLKEGNYWNAADAFRQATRMHPREARYWSHLALALSNMGKRMKEAEESLLRAIELEPLNTEYRIQLGEVYRKIKIRTRARKQFEKVLSLDPENRKARDALKELKNS